MVDWWKIPGNPVIFKELVRLLDSGNAVGFVGAGASAGLYPLWPRLIARLAEAARTTKAERQAWLRLKDLLQAARLIRGKLGEGTFAAQMQEIFGPKEGLDGKRFTSTHAALAQLGFRALVTTNYDPALTFACQQFLSKAVHPFDWREDGVTRWLGRQQRDDEFPILHAHGRWDVKDSLVLDAQDYRRAYGDERYRELFKQLWTQEGLVVVGFGLEDPWLRHIAEQVLSRIHARELTSPRHVALIGLRDTRRANVEVQRAAIEEPWHLRALFYPVISTGRGSERKEDHSALGLLLEDLLNEIGKTKGSATGAVPSVTPKPDPLATWFDHVEDVCRQVEDGFERPQALRLLEQAWVQVMVQRAAQEPALAKGRPEVPHEVLGQPTTLDTVLELPVGEPSWNEGRWLLEGPPGSGKTTLLRYLAARLARQASAECIPVFVPLPRLVEEDRDLLTYVTGGLKLAGADGVREALVAAGREGRLVLLLDSYDEVPSGGLRDTAKGLIRRLRRDPAWRSSKLVVSSRPIGRGEALEELPRLNLLPLDAGRRREFLENWLRHSGQEDWQEEAGKALAYLTGNRWLRELSGIPLYLTLLATLWQQGKKPSGNLAKLYEEVFELLLDGRYRKDPQPIPLQDEVLAALRHLAYGMTEDDLWAEPLKRLDARLRAEPDLCRQLGGVEAWRDNLYAFLRDVYEKTQILGPHDGAKGDWRFWHRTFREALTAEHLRQQHEETGAAALVQWAGQLQEGGEGRWAEPLALLISRLDQPDELLLQLRETNPELALRAAAFAQNLKPETVLTILAVSDDLDERAAIFERIPDQLGDAGTCLSLVEQLHAGCRNGFDLFWLWWIVEEVERRWSPSERTRHLLAHFFDHIPPPADPELLWSFESALDGRVELWRKIPAGEGWVGSPEDEKERYDDEGPRHRVKIADPFWLGAVPVSNAQYAAFDPTKPFHRWPGVPDEQLPGHPRVAITWYEAVSFCRWLGTLPGFRSALPRLPMEEEWEYACRADTPSRFWKGDGEADLAAVGWFGGNAEDRTHRVGGKPANAWGLYDVHGNVWEWTVSLWDPERYEGRSPEPPHAVDSAALSADLAGSPRGGRVLRGGCYGVTAQGCRSAYRWFGDPWIEFWVRGFRVLLSSVPSRD